MGERRVASTMMIGGLVLVGLAWSAALGDTVSGLEEDVFRFFNDGPDWLEAPIWPIMQLGSIAVVPVVGVAGWFLSKRWRLAAGLVFSASVAWVLAKVVKEIVGRGRPQEFLANINFRPEWEGLGFVSGHAAVAFAMAAILSPYVTRPWRVVVWSLAVATAILRMYTAAHLPLDVIGGAGLGIAVAGLWRLVTPAPRASAPVAG